MTASSESVGRGADPTTVLIRRCAAAFSAATQRVERNPSRAAVHEVRVGVRRLRSLLRAFRKDLHPILRAGLQFELKNMARSLEMLRDASVRAQLLLEMRRSSHEHAAAISRKELGSLIANAADTERRLQSEARQHLVSAAWEERKEGIRDALSNPALLAVNSRARPRLCKRTVGRCLKRVSRRLGGKTAQRDLHRLRLAVKQARYLVEALGETANLPDDLPCKDLTADLRKLQNSLGDINDHFGLREWTLTAAIDATTRRALLREIDVRIDARIRSFRRLHKKVREPFRESASALVAAAT